MENLKNNYEAFVLALIAQAHEAGLDNLDSETILAIQRSVYEVSELYKKA